MLNCFFCTDNSNAFFESKLWFVEHAINTSIEGWLLIVLKQHKTALHQLSSAEYAELSNLIFSLSLMLREVHHCDKEYLFHLSDGKTTKHIHFHLVARPKKFQSTFKGKNLLKYFGKNVANKLTNNELNLLIQDYKNKIRYEDWNS